MWVTQCCWLLYTHTHETRTHVTRNRKYTTHSLVSLNARIIFAVFLWVQSRTHARTGADRRARRIQRTAALRLSPQTTREICVRCPPDPAPSPSGHTLRSGPPT